MNPPPAKKSSDSPEAPAAVLSTRSAMTIPVVVIVVGLFVSNLTMFFDMKSKTSVLGEKLTAVATDVTEMKGVLTKFTASTSAELRALRKENTDLREKFNAELTNLKVQLAKLTPR